jgi:hypothetical protein
MHDDSRHTGSGSPGLELCSNNADARARLEPVHLPGEPLVITIREIAPGRHEARHRQVLLCRSAQPLLDGARALLAAGCDPSAALVMRREGSDLDALRTRVGVAAGLTVDETNIRFARWKPRLSQIGQTSIAPLRRSASPLAAGPFHRSGGARA